ncbi:serine hydrolase domain-containing protein [Bryobacter aggregatus]|uniref:serine hydrolase domain-containing protein n=1 Tax=Bryobacter aggregatus TaxID=360054 RepID=UPI0004E15F2B|nr:serine hydrolase [Bryobacter aggregatus]
MRFLIPVLLCIAAPVFGEDYFPKPDSAGGWRTLKDAAAIRKTAGLDLRRLDQAFDYATRTSQHGGLLVVRHGWLVYERYYGRGNREAIPATASVGKVYTSIAVGMGLTEKKAAIPDGLDTKVFNSKYLPQAMPLDDPAKAEITLGQLLSMSAGLHGEGSNPGFIGGVPSVKLNPIPRPATPLDQDLAALRTPLWTQPGGGYSYASSSPHIASIVLRNLTGMEMDDYLDKRLAKPMGWGQWAWAKRRGDVVLPHAAGGGDIALRSTDHLRFLYSVLHKGRWGNQQLIPADYIALCGKPTKWNTHAPMSLMWENNADGHLAGAPKDAFFKSGGGGYGVIVIPSLDMIIYKMSGDDSQYDPARTGLKQDYPYDGSREGWTPALRSQFSDGPIGTDDGVRRIVEMVSAAVVD